MINTNKKWPNFKIRDLILLGCPIKRNYEWSQHLRTKVYNFVSSNDIVVWFAQFYGMGTAGRTAFKYEGENLTKRLALETADFITQNKNEPFFAFLSFYAVHAPIQTTETKWRKYRNKADRLGIANSGYIMERVLPIRQVQDNPIYGGLVETMDDAVGIVLKALQENGLDKNTIILKEMSTGDQKELKRLMPSFSYDWVPSDHIRLEYDDTGLLITPDEPLYISRGDDNIHEFKKRIRLKTNTRGKNSEPYCIHLGNRQDTHVVWQFRW